MAQHSSLHPRSFPTHVLRSHPGQFKSSARKIENRKRKRAEEEMKSPQELIAVAKAAEELRNGKVRVYTINDYPSRGRYSW